MQFASSFPLVLRWIHIRMKSAYWLWCVCVCVFVHLSACINSAPTGWIFVKIYIWDFCENLLRKFKFCYNWTKILSTLCEDPCIHFVVPGDIKSPQKCSSQYVGQKCKRNIFLHFFGNIFIFDYIIDVSYFVYEGSYLIENTVCFHQKELQ